VVAWLQASCSAEHAKKVGYLVEEFIEALAAEP
jgi:hypothetical protein